MSEWISVKDRLPSTIGHYIAYSPGMITWVFFSSNKKWCFDNTFLKGVTHWMPLPKPPEDKDGGKLS